jgi:signal transduction histidine kinase
VVLPGKLADAPLALRQHPTAGSVLVTVTDSGVGLSAEQLARIGGEGVQFNANELQAGQGSGLGMFISKGIVEQHGGSLTVSSPGINLGASVTVELPVFGGFRSLPRGLGLGLSHHGYSLRSLANLGQGNGQVQAQAHST